MRSQPVSGNKMQTTRKRIKKSNASYTLEVIFLDNIKHIKYLGITIINDLKWNTLVSNTVCHQDVKEPAYKGLVRLFLEYGRSVKDPRSILQDEFEKVRKRQIHL